MMRDIVVHAMRFRHPETYLSQFFWRTVVRTLVEQTNYVGKITVGKNYVIKRAKENTMFFPVRF